MTILHQVDPVAVPLPFWPHGIHWYGLMYLAGFAVAWYLGKRRVRAGRLPGVDDNAFGDLLFYAMVGVVLGGRVGYVLFYEFGTFINDPVFLFRIRDGGMSFHGGLLGVLVGVAYWCWKQRLHFFDAVDFVAPLVPAGLGLGRIGNYIGGELWGRLTNNGWGVIFPRTLPEQYQQLPIEQLQQLHASGALDAYARYPSQLYQAVIEGVILFSVLLFFSRKPRPRYAVSGVFALIYGLGRIVVEFFRQPDEQLGFLAFDWLTMGQLLSLPLVIIGLYLLWLSRRSPTLAIMPTTAQPRN